jgi:uncharacterized protein with ParB-like and HNH nuclease domain
MKYESMSIKKAMQMIEDKKLLLPHIQRPFVWKQDRNNNQVKKFFDSILRGYPFGTLLFWITRDEVQVRKFIENYKDNMDIKESYLKSSEFRHKEKTLVLDGQQRLQSLYLALKGTYNKRELYFDVLSGEELYIVRGDEFKYNFEYLTKDEIKEKSNDISYWVLLKDIILSEEPAAKVKRDILKKMKKSGHKVTDNTEEIVDDNISKLKNYFNELELIYYYPIDSTMGSNTDYEEILEIFIRTNSGGTVLSKSDLMFSLIKLSWEDAEEEFEDLLDTINNQESFYFDKDFILKTCLVLLGKGSKYAVDKFKGQLGEQNLSTIRNDWKKIVKSFKWLMDFLNFARITSDEVLPGYNALIPIIYFAYINENKPDSPKVKTNIQTWLYKTLLNGNFSGQADRVIDNCVDIINKSSRKDFFPYHKIEDNMKSKLNRIVDVNEYIIDGNPHLILNLIYLFNNEVVNFQPKLNGNSPEIDHIFPKSKMLRKYKYSSELVNNIGNYMFLEKSLNISKTNKLPDEYFKEAIKLRKDFLKTNYIPNSSPLHKPEKFEKFVRVRRQKIFDTLEQILIYQD